MKIDHVYAITQSGSPKLTLVLAVPNHHSGVIEMKHAKIIGELDNPSREIRSDAYFLSNDGKEAYRSDDPYSWEIGHFRVRWPKFFEGAAFDLDGPNGLSNEEFLAWHFLGDLIKKRDEHYARWAAERAAKAKTDGPA